MDRKFKNANGVLLVDLLLALTILAVGLTACLQVFAQGLHICRRAQEYTLAGHVLDELILKMMSGEEDQLLYEGGEGVVEASRTDLIDAHYAIDSEQISPVPVLSEEELAALAKQAKSPRRRTRKLKSRNVTVFFS